MFAALAAKQVQSSGADATVIAALIAAGAALVTSIMSWSSSHRARKAVETQRTQDYRIRQLNELYGPLYMLRMMSRRLWKQLPGVDNAEPGVTDWKLIDHIVEIKGEEDAKRRLIVEDILKINDQLTELIVGKAGLLERVPPPASFEKFLEHARTLRIYWDQEANVAKGVAHLPFPGEIDDDVREALQTLRRDLATRPDNVPPSPVLPPPDQR